MIYVLLADDDILSLNRLTGLIDWNANGYEIIGQAMGGNDCLRFMEELQPNILILDIDMPDKNGVEVTMELSRIQCTAKILILSNYDTYTFVRDAMRYGAYDYLLKHQLNAPMLLDKLHEMTRLIEKEGASTSQISYFTTIAKQKYLYNLIENNMGNSDIQSHMRTQKDFAGDSFCLSVMQITNFILITHFSPAMGREKLIESITTLASNVFASIGNGLITHMECGRFAIFFHYSRLSSTHEILTQSFHSMRLLLSNIQKIFDLTALYQVSDVFTDVSHLPALYRQTSLLLDQQSFSSASSREYLSLDIMEEKELTEALLALDFNKTRTLLQRISSRYTNGSGQLSQQLVSQLLQIGVRFQQGMKMNLMKDQDTQLTLTHPGNMAPEQITQFLSDYFTNIMERSLRCDMSQYSPHIQNALIYIHENYGNDISLNAMAEKLHLSPTHLSRLFSKEVGTSFIDYLISYRVEQASSLIYHSDLDLKSIGAMTGFHSYNYFLRAYKSKTGHTPSQDIQLKKTKANHSI